MNFLFINSDELIQVLHFNYEFGGQIKKQNFLRGERKRPRAFH